MATFTRALLQGGSRRARQPYPGHALALDFRNGIYRNRGFATESLAALTGLNHSQSGSCWELTPDGAPRAFSANQPRIVPGLGLWARGSFSNLLSRSQGPATPQWSRSNIAAAPSSRPNFFGETRSIFSRISANTNSNCATTISGLAAGTIVTIWGIFRATGIGNRVGLRIQAPYPTRIDAVFDLAAGILAGTFTSGGSITQASITPLDDEMFLCSLSGSITSVAPTLAIVGPTDATRTSSSWEAGSANPSSVEILHLALTAGPQLGPLIVTDTATASNGPSVLSLPFYQGSEDFIMMAAFNMAGSGTGAAIRTLAALVGPTGDDKVQLYLTADGATTTVVRSAGIAQNTGAFSSARIDAGRGVAALRYRGGKLTRAEKLNSGGPNIGNEGSLIEFPAGLANLHIGHIRSIQQLDGVLEGVRLVKGSFSDSEFANQITGFAA